MSCCAQSPTLGCSEPPRVALVVNEPTSIGFTVHMGRFAFNLTTMGPTAEFAALAKGLETGSVSDLETAFDAQIRPVVMDDVVIAYDVSPLRGIGTQNGSPADSFVVRLSTEELFSIMYQMRWFFTHNSKGPRLPEGLTFEVMADSVVAAGGCIDCCNGNCEGDLEILEELENTCPVH